MSGIVAVWIFVFTVILSDWMKDVDDIISSVYHVYICPLNRRLIIFIGFVTCAGLLLLCALEAFGAA